MNFIRGISSRIWLFLVIILLTSACTASIEDAKEHLVNREYQSAIEILEWLSVKGVTDRKERAQAQFLLANIYYKPLGVKRDIKLAVEFFTQSAAAGLNLAQFDLANLYYKGDLVEQDIGQAIYWYNNAALAGHGLSMVNLGVIYDYGIGVRKNPQLALFWYQKAANKKEPLGYYNLAQLYYKGIIVKKDYTMAHQLFKRSADMGVPEAKYDLGLMHYLRKAPKSELQLAYFWFSQAALDNNYLAFNKLAYFFEQGIFVEPSDKSALTFYLLSDFYHPSEKKFTHLSEKMTVEDKDLAQDLFDQLKRKRALKKFLTEVVTK
ncbi:MAG: sel1 repeat family protein [SAR324 cluster bacterium]|nr:sel1 repeat family protein [SAR324 cluster bacterium]